VKNFNVKLVKRLIIMHIYLGNDAEQDPEQLPY
jgi:hypothetical protein